MPLALPLGCGSGFWLWLLSGPACLIGIYLCLARRWAPGPGLHSTELPYGASVPSIHTSSTKFPGHGQATRALALALRDWPKALAQGPDAGPPREGGERGEGPAVQGQGPAARALGQGPRALYHVGPWNTTCGALAMYVELWQCGALAMYVAWGHEPTNLGQGTMKNTTNAQIHVTKHLETIIQKGCGGAGDKAKPWTN